MKLLQNIANRIQKPLSSMLGVFLIAAVMMTSMMAKASTSSSWNFSYSDFRNLGTISSSITVNNLIFLADSSKTMRVYSAPLSLDGTIYTYCLALGGSGSTSYRAVKVPVSGSDTIKVTMKSSGTSVRSLVVANASGSQLTTLSAGTNLAVSSYYYSGNSGYVYLYSAGSGINLYKIQVDSYMSSTGGSSESSSVPSGAIVVDKNGSGNYTTVQAAINSLGSYSTSAKTIYVKNGIYNEVVTIPYGVSNLKIKGESKNTVIQYDNYNGKSNGNGGTLGTGGSAAFFLFGSSVTLENLTIKNSFVEKGNNNEQAVALYVTGTKDAVNNCNIIGNQDTLLCDGGTQYFYNCLIAGDVDFIFGQSQAYFEKCEIRSLNHGSSYNNGYIAAPRTKINADYGFVFKNCNVTCESGTAAKTVWLGRPWCPSGTSVNKPAAAFINCTLGAHIAAEGWTSMSGVPASFGRFYEYGSTGSGAAVNSSRIQLSAAQAANYTKSNVLNGWNPSF